eukprot:CAMPEP_0177650362 /NCGR_PEP_ID=MMETSP0447-20121125/11900_1 /TAXON_ID=0 /ORGANISM="Stygamoeba regulata, Strain BSH-02190019" /LENGTH=574 /DNA_ID=CAMNT_0019153223 /DNA_START=197 /DNA_END=1921 /DNA_ORIENTATION=+
MSDPQAAQRQGPSRDPIPLGEDGKPMYTKKVWNKMQKKLKKEQATAARAASQGASGPQKQAAAADYTHLFGDKPVNRSQKPASGLVLTRVEELDLSLVGKEVTVRCRVESRRGKGNLCFLVLRQQYSTAQAVVSKSGTVPKPMVTFCSKISLESIVDVIAQVVAPENPVESVTQSAVELAVKKLFVVSRAQELPIQVTDCARSETVIATQKKELAEVRAKLATIADPESAEAKALEESARRLALGHVGQKLRLDNRFIDLRTPANRAIFRLQSGVCTLFREFLLQNRFTEIHSPKMIGVASEGGSEVFAVEYFDRKAYLAQSPQLYKQMAIMADFERVFEIGPVFRAENAHTHRHLTEFNGLDLEMEIKEHYHEVLDMLEGVFLYIFDGLNERFAPELAAVNAQFPFEPLVYQKPSLRLKWPEIVSLLRGAGVEMGDLDDMDTPSEKLLGKLVKAKYGVDFYLVDEFPTNIRPFYTMIKEEDPNYTNSYDFFVRGEEICSGAQRIHDYDMLCERAKAHEIPLESIAGYLDSFKYGAPMHGGGGVGMERILMLFLGLRNIRRTSLFPRDPNRLSP